MVQRPEDLAATLVQRARRQRVQDEKRLSRARGAAMVALRECIADGTVARAWLIGSSAWGGAHARSDLDIVVEGASREAVGALWDRVSDACGMDVDLLFLEELAPSFRQRVLAEGIPVHGS
jgi:predicted nucleotidyltransferase